MSQQLHDLTHGLNGLILGYITVLIPMLLGLRQGRAPVAALQRGPLLAIPVTLIGGIVVSIVTPAPRGPGVDGETLAQFVFGTLICIAVGYAAGRLIAVRKRSPDATQRRGAVVTRTPETTGSSRSRPSSRDERDALDPNTPVTLAGIPVPPKDETKHFKLIGTTGTGKSTAIRELLSTALARGDRAIIADPDGGYLDTFYDAGRGDVILNPFAADAAKWSLLSEITNVFDVEQLARSLIPDNGDSDRAWCDYARTFFAAVIQQVIAAGTKDDAEVDRFVTLAPVGELRELLEATAAGPLLAEGNERMFGIVRSITTSAIRALKYTTQQQGTPFSVRAWVSQGAARQAGGPGGVLFFPYKAAEIAALRSMISAWMRLAIFEAMNRGEGDQRLWFIVDELDALGEIDGLKDALARLRKFGGRSVLGFQSIAQVSTTYGKGTAGTIVENCGNTFILRCSASEHGGTAEFASKLIGQREISHTTQSRTRRQGEWRSSTTTSEQVRIEPAVMSSEIERLPDLEGFLKFASIPDWRHVTLPPPSGSAAARGRHPYAAASTAAPIVAMPQASPVEVTPAQPSPSASPEHARPPSRPTRSAQPPRKRERKRKTRTRAAKANGAEPPTANDAQQQQFGGDDRDGAGGAGRNGT